MGWICVLAVWVAFLHSLDICTCLKDLKISVPEAVAVGDAALLSCYYNLENATLYSVRWYFEGEEFYRFVPKENPPSRVFTIDGIIVDLTKSNEYSVALRSVKSISGGVYRCEVSGDAPLFHTATGAAKMVVIQLPDYNPNIKTFDTLDNELKKNVAIGDQIKANCTSGPSHPPVNFTWSINGNRLPATNGGLRPARDTRSSNESQETWSELVTRIDHHVLQPKNRKIVILCETNIFTIYRGSAEAQLMVSEESFWLAGGKVSPTTDQRSNTSRGDPDNSALQASAVIPYDSSVRYMMVQQVMLWLLLLLVYS